MKKIILILFIMHRLLIEAGAQKILTLKECYDKAFASSDLAGEKTAYTEIWQLKDKNLTKGWLPSLDANGSFIYNSSVVDMTSALGSLPIPNITDFIKPLPHEQYRFTLDINQVIYDGGAIKSARDLEKAALKVNEKQNETDLYNLRSQINSCYFNILLLERQKELLNNYLELVNKRIAAMQSGIVNGLILRSDIDILASEKIRLGQQVTENEIRRSSFIKILEKLTGAGIDATTQFILPSVASVNDEISRPELQLFDLRKEQLNAGLNAAQSKRMPRAFGFATLGYGNPPGNNFFRDEFAPYYILGAGIKWNIFDWNRVRNEKQVIRYQQDMIDSRKADLTDNIQRMLDAKNSEIESLEALLATDTELISLRKKITATAESQYENETITATEYLNEMNSERQAALNYEIHKINLAMAKIEYMNISGQEIE